MIVRPKSVRASRAPRANSRRIYAEDEMEIEDVEAPAEGDVSVAPEATDLLFEAEDVAELLAEVTGEAVEVTADEDQVVFAVGEEEYTAIAEGDEEVLEATRKSFRGKRRVSASRRVAGRKAPVAASRRTPAGRSNVTAGRSARKMPRR